MMRAHRGLPGRAVLPLLLLLLGGAGCLISGTKVITYLVGTFDATADPFDSITIDLTNDSDYNDYKDDIRKIDRLGFTCQIRNQSGAPVDVSVYFSDRSDLTAGNVASVGQALFENFQVTGGGVRTINYDDSLALLPASSFRELQDLIDAGAFTLYSLATGSGINMRIEDLTLIITFTVGL